MFRVHFNLTSLAPFTVDLVVDDDNADVKVLEGSKEITVDIVYAKGRDEAGTKALDAANNCLSHLSWKYERALKIN